MQAFNYLNIVQLEVLSKKINMKNDFVSNYTSDCMLWLIWKLDIDLTRSPQVLCYQPQWVMKKSDKKISFTKIGIKIQISEIGLLITMNNFLVSYLLMQEVTNNIIIGKLFIYIHT